MKISIIIPTRNRALQLSKTLESISIQELNNDIEIIVIDNGSNDNTKDIVSHFVKRIPNLIYKFDDMPGLLTGRHLGAEIASGEVLSFLDDDVELNPNYLRHLANTFTNNPSIHLATGPCLPEFEITPPKWLEYFWDKTSNGKYCTWLSLLDFGNAEMDISPMFIWGLNFCIRKSTLVELGGFHPDCIPDHLQQFQGDGETGLASKAIKNGISAKYIPGLKLKHYVPKSRLTLEYFKKRAFYQGVCNSFANLRITNHHQENASKERKEIKSIKKKLRDKLHPYYRWIKLLVLPETKSLPKDVKILLNNLAQAEADGYNFHQLYFSNDKDVKDWVLKETYWDYKLPNS